MVADRKATIIDLAIIGAGPAGLAAATYASRYGLETIVIGELVGGMITEAYEVHNFPAHERITGVELASRMESQVKSLGVKIIPSIVNGITVSGGGFMVSAQGIDDGGGVFARKLIIATGGEKKKLGIPREQELIGRGISYCATCDGPLFRDRVVGVVGGGDAALTSALMLSKYAKHVYIICRKERFLRAQPAWVTQVEKESKKITPIFNSKIAKLLGEKTLKGVVLEGGGSGRELELDGLFVEDGIGSTPASSLAKSLGAATDENGFVIVDRFQKTNVKGVFAAGDVTNNPLKQALTAASGGAVAAYSAYMELRSSQSKTERT